MTRTDTAVETWDHIEHLLIDECGLLPDQGLAHQRPNCIAAIRNGAPEPSLLAAAIEFLSSGEGLHKIRVNGEMMDRKQVALALASPIAEGAGPLSRDNLTTDSGAS